MFKDTQTKGYEREIHKTEKSDEGERNWKPDHFSSLCSCFICFIVFLHTAIQRQDINGPFCNM